MPTSASPSPHERAGRMAGKAPDERAVSEVVGYLLVFGILAVVLVLSMVAFNILNERAQTSVVHLEAESAAQRVASSAVNAALFAETHDAATSTYEHPLDLPTDLEGHAYTVYLEAANTGSADPDDCIPCPSPPTCTRPEQVRVCIPDLNDEEPITAPLFSAGASTSFDICASQASGGPLIVRFGDVDGVAPFSYCVYLEALP